MTLGRTRPARRLQKMPAATKVAERPLGRVPGSPKRGRREGGSVNVVVWGALAQRAVRFLHKIALDEDVDVAVEHAVDVADLLFRAVVLGHLIRMQHVTADMTAEADLFLDAADLIEL